jgi:TP901 family phage tail tape measure protein
MNSYAASGLSAADATADLLNAVVAGKTRAEDLARTFGRVASIGAVAGLEHRELAGAVAAVTTKGIQTESAVSGVRQAIVNVLKPTKVATDEAERLGISFNAATLKSKGLGGFLKMITSSSGYTAESMSKLFGDVDGLAAVMALAGDNGVGFNNVMKQMAVGTAQTDNALQKMTQTLAFQFKRLHAVTGNLSKQVGMLFDRFGPNIERMINRMQSFVDVFSATDGTAAEVRKGIESAFNKMAAAVTAFQDALDQGKGKLVEFVGQENIAKIAEIITIFAVAGGALAPFIVMAGGAIVAIGTLFQAVATVFAGLQTAAAVIGGAISQPLLIAIGSVMLAFELFRNQNESYLDAAIRLWDLVKGAVMSVWTTAIQPFIDGLTNAFMPAISALGDSWNEIKNSITSAFSELFEFFSAGQETTTTDWLEVGQTIGSILAAAATTLATVASFLIYVLTNVITIVVEIGATIANFIIAPFEAVWNLVKQVGASVLQILSGDVIGAMKRLGLAILDFVLTPLKMVVGAFVDISDMAKMPVPQAVRDFANKELAAPVLLSEKKKEDAKAAGEALGMGAEKERQKADKAPITVMGPPAPPIDVNVKSCVQVDGKEVARSTAKVQKEIGERAGFRATPWQRRQMVEQGAIPMRTGG